jgi:hypothetical protein
MQSEKKKEKTRERKKEGRTSLWTEYWRMGEEREEEKKRICSSHNHTLFSFGNDFSYF